jgi:hypothetical protein
MQHASALGKASEEEEPAEPQPKPVPMEHASALVGEAAEEEEPAEPQPKLVPVVLIGSVQFETKDGYFSAASLVLNNDEGLLEVAVEGGPRLAVKLTTVSVASASSLSYTRGCKLVLECTATTWSRIGLLKLWFRHLSEIEAVMDSISVATQRKASTSSTVIPKILHTPALLRFYSPTLRRVINVLDDTLAVVAYLSFLFYATNVLALFPLDFLDSVLTWAVWVYVNLQATPLLLVPLCMLAPVVLPLLGLLPLIVLAVYLAQRYLHALLSLQLLYDTQRLLSAVSKVRSFINRMRGVKRALKGSKRPKVHKLE